MNPSNSLPMGQNWFLELMGFLNYQINREGMCFGLAHMANQAILANDLETFTNRLFLIYQAAVNIKQLNPLNNTKLSIEERHDVFQKQLELSGITKDKSLKLYYEILAFFDGICIAQEGGNLYSYLFEHDQKPTQENIFSFLPLIVPDELKKRAIAKGLQKPAEIVKHINADMPFTTFYDHNDIFMTLFRLSGELKNCPTATPIVMHLNSTDHSITISYNPKYDVWLVIDANFLPPKYYISPLEVVDAIKTSLINQNNDSFSMNVYIEQGDKVITDKLQNWLRQEKKQVLQNITNKVNSNILNKDSKWLYVASQVNDIEVVNALTQQTNIDTNGVTARGLTSLFTAIINDNTEVVKILLNKGADITQVFKGKPPLFIAAELNRADAVKLLQAKGAKVDEPCNGLTPLYVAAQRGHVSVVKALLEHGALINQPCHSSTPLTIAIEHGHESVAKLLLDHGALIDKNDYEKMLSTAAKKGLVSIVKILLDLGAPVDDMYMGFTPLHHAARYGHAEIIKILLEKGANANQVCGFSSPFYIAAEHGHVDAVKLLADAGADIHRPAKGYYPLNIAARYGHHSVVEFLLDNGANINKPCFGVTPLYSAAQNGHKETVKILLSRLNKDSDFIESLVVLGVYGDDDKAVDVLLKAKENLDVNNIEYQNQPLLLIAINEKSTKVVDLLIKLQADVNKICKAKTPLYLALEQNDHVIIKSLIMAGADVNQALKIALDNHRDDLVNTLLQIDLDAMEFNNKQKIITRSHWFYKAVKDNDFDILYY